MKILSHRIANPRNLQSLFKRFEMGNRWIVTLIVLMVLMAISPLTRAAEPLVDAVWVNDHLNNIKIRIIDLQPASGYMQGHIPGAVHTRYADWRKTNRNGTPGMLPPKDYLERLIGGLGIDNQMHIVLVPPGHHVGDLAMATRIYWTLKVLGHDEISILNGGMAAYTKMPSAQIDRGEVKAEKRIFKAIMKREDAPIAKDVMQALKNNVVLVDSRSPGEYVGTTGSHSSNRSGTMPGAVNQPYSWLAEKGAGRFPDQRRLKLIFLETKVPTTGDQFFFCHTGHRASLSWFVSHELLGNHQAKMYDGSMAEWVKSLELPMVSKTPTDR